MFLHRYARTWSRLASAVLGLVFIALLGCIIVGASTIERAADRTLAAVTQSQLYESLERQLLTEASLVRVHGLDPQGSGWYEERAAAVASESTLATIESSGSVVDRGLAKKTDADHDRYIDVLLALFAQIDANDPAVSSTFKRSNRIFDAMQQRVEARALQQHQYAVDSLRELSATQHVIAQLIAAVSILGVALLGACVVVIVSYQRVIRDARSEKLARLERNVFIDHLTGLGNHRAYQDDLEREVSRVERHGGELSLAIIDIDNFKHVNDRMGHVQGDTVLAALGERLHQLRKEDRAYRLGGDEFSLILPATNVIDAALVMERVRLDAAVGSHGVRLSIGIASNAKGVPIDPVLLREQADAALYAAKQLGRDMVMTYPDACTNALVIPPDKEHAVRALIDAGEIDVVFQPIWDVRTMKPLGFEALVRPADRFQLAGPQEAFDIAERIGRAPELDAVCIQAVLNRAHELPHDALLFLNIVPETLDRNLLVGMKLVEAARAAGLAPQRIVIELTERAMPRLDVIVREAKRLQGLGFHIALDDTGAGNAGLEVLRRLSVEYVKIDRLVLIQAMVDPIARAILAGIVAIARAMNSYIIAEGIETIEQLDFVHRDVMDSSFDERNGFAIQGYLLGRPGPAPWTQAKLPLIMHDWHSENVAVPKKANVTV